MLSAADSFRERKITERKQKSPTVLSAMKIPHSFDIASDLVPVKASDVLLAKTGICHAKANLFAAILRHEKSPPDSAMNTSPYPKMNLSDTVYTASMQSGLENG